LAPSQPWQGKPKNAEGAGVYKRKDHDEEEGRNAKRTYVRGKKARKRGRQWFSLVNAWQA